MNNQITATTFGNFFRQRRISLGLTLRTFSNKFAYDPGNISRLERNIFSPSLDNDKLKGLAKALQIEESSLDWVTFFDLAHTSKGRIPNDIVSNVNTSQYLPLLFRTVRGKKLSRKKLQEVIKLINES